MTTTPDALQETTSAVEAWLDLEAIKGALEGADPAKLLPDLEKVFGYLEPVCRISVMLGPVLLLLLGLSYLILSPKEANYYLGYRCYFGMGSEYAWRFTQRCAGFLFTGAGLVLTVVMFTITAGFAALEVTEMVWKATVCLLIQLGTTILLILSVNISAMARFDRKGNYRRKRKK